MSVNPEIYHAGLLGAVAEALSLLLEPGDFDLSITEALHRIGEAANVDRVYVLERQPSSSGAEPVLRQHYEWVRETHSLEVKQPQTFCLERFPLMLQCFHAGLPYHGLTRDFSAEERALLEPNGVLSVVLTPIILNGELWGLVGLDDCHRERGWSDQEQQSLKAAAAGLGGAIVRHQIEASFKKQAVELRRHQRVALSLAEDARLSEQEAAQASLAKTTFLAMMSHEIRTPLNGVIGFTDLLLAEGLPDRQSEIAHGIKTCGETLLSLISDILDISKIESGRLELHPVRTDIEREARGLLATFDPQAQKNGIELRLTFDSAIPPYLLLDLNRFRQILFNLIGNAVKFTREGYVEVRFWAEPKEDGLLLLYGCVNDTGTGISAKDLRAIFEPFQQGESARTSALGGSGLGLAICRRLIEAMGGEIQATSAPGRGSQFTFFIKVRESGEIAPSAAQAIPPLITCTDVEANILVVDDVRMNVRLAISLLARLGYAADAAEDGLQAFGMVKEKEYDIVFLDILMPEMDGYAAARAIREFQAAFGLKRSWIVAITADALPENRQGCADAGMDDFLTKPLRMKDIEQALTNWNAGRPTLR